jgi:hypothetical protein
VRHRLVLALVALSVVFAAVPADAATPSVVHVTGRVLDEAGHPVAGARVELTNVKPAPAGRSPGFGEAFLCLISFTLVCPWFWEDPPPVPDMSHPVARAVTDRNGRYRMDVPSGWYAVASGEHRIDVRRSVPGAADVTTRTYLDFDPRHPALRGYYLWMHAATFDTDRDGDGDRALHVPAIPKRLGSRDGYTRATVLQGRAPLRVLAGYDRDFTFDDRWVEKGVTGVVSAANGVLYGRSVTYYSGTSAVTGQVTPLSRGARCSKRVDAVTLAELKGCRFTDGVLGGNLASYLGGAGTVVVDLGEPVLLEAVLPRGCRETDVAFSVEGVAFVPWVTSEPNPEPDELVTGPTVLARYVQVDLAHCDLVSPEIAVFGTRVLPQVPPQPGSRAAAIRVAQSKVPVTGWYSFVYQNVQSSTGSTVIAL